MVQAHSRAVDPAPSLTRHVLIPLSLVVCFVLVYWVRVPSYWVLIVGGPAALLYLGAPAIGRRSLARFDRDVVRLLAARHLDALSGRYRRAWGMRLFSAPALVAERRGMVATQSGASGRARAAYRDALEGYPEDAVPLGVRLGMAHASFALGDDEEAIRHYRLVLRESGPMPHVARNLAHALARRGEDLEEAEALADKALSEADEPSAELRLVRALIHAKRGQRGPARKLLKATETDEDPSLQTLREEVEVALQEV